MYYRQMIYLQDMIQGVEERLVIKEATLSDYRERISSLGALIEEKEERITEMQHGKLKKLEKENTCTATTWINTSILPGDTMGEVRYSITTTSNSRMKKYPGCAITTTRRYRHHSCATQETCLNKNG